MSRFATLPLKVLRDIEQNRSWEGLSTPYELLKYFASRLAVDAEQLSQMQELVYSDVQPTGDDAKKVWIKTDEPVGIGIPNGTGYSVIYKYPANTPFIWTTGLNDLPAYLRQLSQGDLDSYGLTKPQSATVAWVIFETSL